MLSYILPELLLPIADLTGWWRLLWLLPIGGGVALLLWFVRSRNLTETTIQGIVHKLEEGGWAKWIKFGVLIAAIAFVTNLWFFRDNGFRGLAHEKAMEQAQIGRELRRGNGFTTKVIRPAAIWQFEKNKGSFPVELTPDTYHAPLNPFLMSVLFRVMDGVNAGFKSAAASKPFYERFIFEEEMNPKQLLYAYDKMIAFMQLGFFLAAVLVNYFTAKRLFDRRLALLGMGLMLVCEQFWEFSMSGLPQMLLLFLFSGCTYVLVRAVEARYLNQSAFKWNAAAGALFGVMALAHGMAIWVFAGALLFTIFFFRPRGTNAGIMFAMFLLVYAPWLVRNQVICGTPVGLGWYSGLVQIRGSESLVMRSMQVPLEGLSPRIFRDKFQGNTLAQLGLLYEYLGKVLVAPVFFIALLHLFKRPETAVFRWCIGSMWLFALIGMSVFGMPEEGRIRANDMHVLFIPLMSFYGLAFVLVMWSRLEITAKLFRYAFLSLIFVISGLPFLRQFVEFFSEPGMPVQWPPYIPPSTATLRTYTREKEIIASDMPWSVAWYADRKSLWLPKSIKDFIDLNDYNRLSGNIVGLYLTPITGNRAFIADIMKGEYSEWAPFITRRIDTREFPLKYALPMAKDGECIFFSDRDRWTSRED